MCEIEETHDVHTRGLVVIWGLVVLHCKWKTWCGLRASTFNLYSSVCLCWAAHSCVCNCVRFGKLLRRRVETFGALSTLGACLSINSFNYYIIVRFHVVRLLRTLSSLATHSSLFVRHRPPPLSFLIQWAKLPVCIQKLRHTIFFPLSLSIPLPLWGLFLLFIS